jgi:hypothetical protein
MPRIPDIDRGVFSDIEKTNSDYFTRYEIDRIHKIAIELNHILRTIKFREDNPDAQ